jgi:hypothetical protein
VFVLIIELIATNIAAQYYTGILKNGIELCGPDLSGSG